MILIIFIVIITDNIYDQYYGFVRLAYSNSEGEDFYIFNYNSDEIKKVIKKNNFKKNKKELKLFDKTTSISELSSIGNYYLYLELNEKDYFICIIDTIDNKLNVLHVNH